MEKKSEWMGRLTHRGSPGEGARAAAALGLVCRRVSDAPSVPVLLHPCEGDMAKKSFPTDPSAHSNQLQPCSSPKGVAGPVSTAAASLVVAGGSERTN